MLIFRRLCISMLMLTLLLCPFRASAAAYTDGEYTACAQGFGTVTVTLSIRSGQIISVVIDAPGETPGIGTAAVEQMPSQIIAANGTDGVDTVASATITSRAILTAAQDCLNQSVSATSDAALYHLPSALVSIKAEALRGVPAEIVVIPDGCQAIGSRAFADCVSLIQVVIPASVTDIAEDAFAGCEGFTIVTTPESSAASFAAAHGIAVLHN